MLGTVKFYNDAKGFGFITPDADDASSDDVFFHITQVAEGYEPQDGDRVNFEISNGRDGRPAAVNVSPAGEEGSDDQQEEYSEE